jgi:K+-transporting ATPase ATPase C chain
MQSALVQIPRVAKARNLDEETLRKLVLEHVEERQFGFLGEQRINVLKLNLAIDSLK